MDLSWTCGIRHWNVHLHLRITYFLFLEMRLVEDGVRHAELFDLLLCPLGGVFFAFTALEFERICHGLDRVGELIEARLNWLLVHNSTMTPSHEVKEHQYSFSFFLLCVVFLEFFLML